MSDKEVELYAIRRQDLLAEREKIDAALKDIDARLLALLEPGDVADIDGRPAFVVQAGARRWSEKKARELLPSLLPADVLDSMKRTVETIDRETAKATLPPKVYEMCCEQGSPSIRAAK